MKLIEITKKPFLLFIAIPLLTKILFAIVLINAGTINAAPAPSSFADLADKLLPTVVNISSTQKTIMGDEGITSPNTLPQLPNLPDGHPFNDFFDEFMDRQFKTTPRNNHNATPVSSLGSGFIIDKEKGLIITNNHVIDGAVDIKITLHDDTTLPVTIIGVDKKTDLAVLKADLKNQKVNEAKFGNSDVMRVGDWILAIGNPFGLGGTVTAGIISARKRDINSGPYDDYLQTDASINRGNSGGPMFNMDGEIIGINTAIFSPTGGSVGIGFAIPSDLANPVIKQLIEFGHTRRGWLGVKIQKVTDEIAENLGLQKSTGALVSEVTPTGPAEKSGIQAGDIILAFDNKPVRSMRALPRIVAETDIDKEVAIVLWRKGQRINLTANIGQLETAEKNGLLDAHSKDDDLINSDEQEDDNSENIIELGLTIAPIDKDIRETYDIPKNVNGVIVLDVDINSDAVKKGIDVGDILIDINQKPITSIDVLQKEIENTISKNRNSVLLLINREENIQFVAVKLNKNTNTDKTEEE